MKIAIKTFGLLIFLLAGQFAFGQTNKEKAYEKGMEAIKLTDDGNYTQAISLLKEAKKLDPENINYPYELAYTYYLSKDYETAGKYLEGILKHKDVTDQVYQLLGNCYDNLKNSGKAMDTYKAGLEKFPNSGKLYFEMGIVQLGKNENIKALDYFENGIKVDPKHPSNYYWASKLYFISSEKVWGMIYGELFMNLERNSDRTMEISKLLFDTYKDQIKFLSDTSITVSFSKNATIPLNDIIDMNDAQGIKLPFGVGIYEPTLLLSAVNEKAIDINSLDRIRKNFIELYFKKNNELKYPNVLFDYQNKIIGTGNISAYNHWILMKGDESGFENWLSANEEEWNNFISWFEDNQILIDNNHKFYSGQY